MPNIKGLQQPDNEHRLTGRAARRRKVSNFSKWKSKQIGAKKAHYLLRRGQTTGGYTTVDVRERSPLRFTNWSAVCCFNKFAISRSRSARGRMKIKAENTSERAEQTLRALTKNCTLSEMKKKKKRMKIDLCRWPLNLILLCSLHMDKCGANLFVFAFHNRRISNIILCPGLPHCFSRAPMPALDGSDDSGEGGLFIDKFGVCPSSARRHRGRCILRVERKSNPFDDFMESSVIELK